MRKSKRFIIDVEEEYQENAVFFGEEFLCFEDDSESLVSKLNELKEENERLKNKLNVTALELVDEAISMGKAVEISEMNYHEFLEYRQNKGKPMELQR